jgi:hypothetical protein
MLPEWPEAGKVIDVFRGADDNGAKPIGLHYVEQSALPQAAIFRFKHRHSVTVGNAEINATGELKESA